MQYYRDGSDYISEHTDKTLDIKINTSIINFSLGATRKMQLKHKKKDFKTNERKKQNIYMVHNSMFELG